jgi:hypothetical protein
MADLSEKELKNAFLKALQDYDAATNNGSAGGGTSPETAKNTEAQKDNTAKLAQAAEAAGGFAGKIIEGGARFKDATSALEKGFSLVGGETGKLGAGMAASAAGLNKLGGALDQNIDTWRKLSDTGLSFGNDVMQMKDQSSKARLSIAEMSDVLTKNNTNLVGLGVTAGDSAKKFSQVSDTFFTSGLGEGLRSMGYTTKELNDVLAVSVSAQKIGIATGKISEAEAAASAQRLATEMDAVAKLTGKSKQEQLDDLKRKQEDGQLRAATELAVRQGGEKVRGAFQEMSTASQIGGKDFQKLQEQMFAMGRPSQDMAAKFAMAGGEVQSLMKQAADAAKAGKSDEAKRLTEQAATAYAARQNSNEMLQLAAQGEENAVQMNANSRQLTDGLEAVAKANNLDLSKTQDRIKAKELLDQRVAQDQKGQDKDGKEAPTKAITEFAVNVESRGRDLTKALNDQLIQPLAQKTGPELKKFNDTLLGINGLKGINLAADKADRQGTINQAPKTIEQEKKDQGITKSDKNYADVEKLEKLLSGGTTKDSAADALKKIAAKEEKKPDELIANAMKDKGAGAADLTKKLQDALPDSIKKMQAYEERTGKTMAPEAVRIANRDAGIEPVGLPGLARTGVDKVGDGITAFGGLFTKDKPGQVQIVPGGGSAPAATPPTERRAGGSLDMAGKMFEDWGKGTMVELHGLEGVMRPQDISKVIESAMGGVRKTMPKIDMNSTDAGSSKIDLSNISKSISTSISSVSGGKETTTKGPDMKEMSMGMAKMGMNDDQKKVFDEMMSMSAQQSKEKLQSLVEEKASAQLANIEAAKARDAIEERLEAEGKGIKDLVGADKERFDALTAQMNSSADAQDKAKEAITAAERAEQNRLSLQKMGYEVGIKQEEDKTKIVETNAEQIKSYIAESLPVKDMAAKQAEFQSQFTESQQKILDDYKGYSEGNRVAHAEAMESGIKEDTETAQMIGARISKMKADIGDRQATEEEAAALANEEANKKLFENRVVDKKEMLDIMQNLDEYSATREQELEQKKADDAKASAKVYSLSKDGVDVPGLPTENSNESVAELQMAAQGIDSKKAAQTKVPNLDSISFGPNGMPMFKQMEAAKQTLSKDEKSTDKKAEAADASKPKTDKKEDKSSTPATKEATLSDVVASLNQLNTKMGQMLAQQADIGNKQVRATKSNSSNLYT